MAGAECTIVWDDRFRSYDFGSGHPFSEVPRWLAARLLTGSALPAAPARFHKVSDVRMAGPEELGRFHDPGYLREVERASESPRPVALDAGDTPSFPGCYDASARIVGGALVALRSIIDGGPPRAFHLAGGLHHAHPGRASGFCIFNDVAVAIASAVGEGGPYRRLAYIDIDAHHGDGVMYGFYESGRVLDIDFHQDGRTLFPGTGAIEETGRKDGDHLKVNVPLPPGAGDATFQPIFRRIVPALLRSYRPELIVLQHGMDAHRGDRLARLDYTRASYATALGILRSLADELCGGRLLVTGGGGYHAAHVALGLASAGLLLSGSGPPAAERPLPERWRSEFAHGTGEEAPVRWGDPADRPGPTRPSEDSERLVHAIGGRLGRRFPDE